MAEIVNLRRARKRAERIETDKLAAEQRLIHGTPKRARARASAERDKATQLLDRHRIDTGDRE